MTISRNRKKVGIEEFATKGKILVQLHVGERALPLFGETEKSI